jgi:predicted short-subunit dehydrogenase-like oxidoreductase (DUF2520 family)
MNLNLAFIGSGNVATHLAKAFEATGGFNVVDIWSRQLSNAQTLAQNFEDCNATANLDFSESLADVFFLCIKDDAFDLILDQLILPSNAVLVHTSGTKSLEILNQWSNIQPENNISVGVFYPLQTFSKEQTLTLENVPICIEAVDEVNEDFLVTIAQDISESVYVVSSEERLKLHLAAVFSCNFANHLWAISQEWLSANELSFDMLKPLITETLRKALEAKNIADVQTGPARRGDHQTIDQHLQMLENQPQWHEIYQTLSQSILKKHEG